MDECAHAVLIGVLVVLVFKDGVKKFTSDVFNSINVIFILLPLEKMVVLLVNIFLIWVNYLYL